MSEQYKTRQEWLTELAVTFPTWDSIAINHEHVTIHPSGIYLKVSPDLSVPLEQITQQDFTNECHRLLNRGSLPRAPSWARYLALDFVRLTWHWYEDKPYYRQGEWFPPNTKSEVEMAGFAIALPAGFDCAKNLIDLRPELKDETVKPKSIIETLKKWLKGGH